MRPGMMRGVCGTVSDRPAPRTLSRLPHVTAALWALLVLALLVGAWLYARWAEARYVYALAPMGRFTQKIHGRALQAEALRHPDLLLALGSSELNQDDNSYSGAQVFQRYPTGFTVFTAGLGGRSAIHMLQDVAALGSSALRGRKVVVVMAASYFFDRLKVGPGGYDHNFSRLHAYALAFGGELGADVVRAAARRMLEYPETLDKDPLLAFALAQLARDGPAGRALYWAAWPLGKLGELILRLQDHGETVTAIWRQRQLRPDVSRVPAAIDWPALLSQAEGEDSRDPNHSLARIVRTGGAPAGQRAAAAVVLQRLQQSAEWSDVDLLLRALRTLGAEVLYLSPPAAGTFYDSLGVSREARMRLYYDRLHELGRRYGVTVLTFADFDEDETFLWDTVGHPSRKGWVLYAQALDRFYHDGAR